MLLFLAVLKILFPVFLLGLVGFIWSKWNFDYPIDFVTRLTMNIALPCLIFTSLMNTDIDSQLLNSIILGSVLTYIILTICCYIFIRLIKIDNATYLPPMIFGNTGNLGLPLAYFSFGSEGLNYAIIIFTVMGIYSFTFGIWILSGNSNYKEIVKSPIFISCILGSISLFTGIKTPDFVTNSIELIGQMAIPLMLITLGVSVATLKLKNFYMSFYVVIYRTVICLAVSIGVALYFNFPDVPTAILILQLTTPVAVTSYLLSEKYKRNPSEVASLVVLSTVLSIVYIPIILSFLI